MSDNKKLWKRVEEAAKKVATWPAWKIGSRTNTRKVAAILRRGEK